MKQAAPEDNRRERLLFLGSGLILVGTLLVGISREQHWGERFLNLNLVARNAEGLSAGQEVRISGLQVGQVRSLQLQPDATVSVNLQVAERYANLVGPRTIASQGQVGFVGDHYLVLSADPRGQKSDLALHQMQGKTIPYQQPAAISSLMQELNTTQKALQATLHNTTKLSGKDVPDTLRDVRKALGSVEALSAVVQQETAATAPTLRQTLTQISATGASAEATSNQAQQVLAETKPILVDTLKELQDLSSISRRLLRLLAGLGEILNETPTDPSR